jgi:hypothetical protein
MNDILRQYAFMRGYMAKDAGSKRLLKKVVKKAKPAVDKRLSTLTTDDVPGLLKGVNVLGLGAGAAAAGGHKMWESSKRLDKAVDSAGKATEKLKGTGKSMDKANKAIDKSMQNILDKEGSLSKEAEGQTYVEDPDAVRRALVSIGGVYGGLAGGAGGALLGATGGAIKEGLEEPGEDEKNKAKIKRYLKTMLIGGGLGGAVGGTVGTLAGRGTGNAFGEQFAEEHRQNNSKTQRGITENISKALRGKEGSLSKEAISENLIRTAGGRAVLESVKDALLGGSIGAGAGVVRSALVEDAPDEETGQEKIKRYLKNVLKGTAAGAGIGMGMGFFKGTSKGVSEHKERSKDLKGLSDAIGGGVHQTKGTKDFPKGM